MSFLLLSRLRIIEVQISELVGKVQDTKSDLVAWSEGDDIVIYGAHLIRIEESMHEAPCLARHLLMEFASD